MTSMTAVMTDPVSTNKEIILHHTKYGLPRTMSGPFQWNATHLKYVFGIQTIKLFLSLNLLKKYDTNYLLTVTACKQTLWQKSTNVFVYIVRIAKKRIAKYAGNFILGYKSCSHDIRQLYLFFIYKFKWVVGNDSDHGSSIFLKIQQIYQTCDGEPFTRPVTSSGPILFFGESFAINNAHHTRHWTNWILSSQACLPKPAGLTNWTKGFQKPATSQVYLKPFITA